MTKAVSGAGYDKLLSLFDADSERAAAVYAEARRKLTKYFEWRGCHDAELCADTTLERVARRLDEGATVTSGVYAFIHGVAANVVREQFRQRERSHEPLDEAIAAPFDDDPISVATRHAAEERKFTCLERCLRRLPSDQRRALLQYHDGEARTRIAARQKLATSLGITLTALRLRMFRLREALERCIEHCAAGQRIEIDLRQSH